MTKSKIDLVKEKILLLKKKVRYESIRRNVLLMIKLTYFSRLVRLFARWQNSSEIKRLRNIHKGERCVIVGMGPSLKIEDLEKLKGTITFACNKVFLAYEKTNWRPNYYTVSDVLIAKNSSEEIALTLQQSKGIFPEWVRHCLPENNDILWIPVAEKKEYFPGSGVGFSINLENGIQPGGCTVLYDQIQIAFHMGFSEVILIGVDFYYSGLKKTGEFSEQGEIVTSTGDVNHFHKDYLRPGESSTVPKIEEQKIAYRVAKKVFEDSGRKLINGSRKTFLEELERGDFDELFS
ncbi:MULTISPECIES: 6-hydroxymethylpterin diphosphokinase MptE-like protein [unclassified Dolichospermum]|uniref:6-hydroxymethylpterin diphosphokinase MptE-like protein n=1 Tax=unclassified Dolichospermum TaxID=2622029 RepID=UPI0014485610|nr:MULTISPECIES: 6-hydroxymethylpterin diphosphokinase MptE-like protein [unclassified Dolichospermum]MTJ16847.1 DUF115 domain-containing protein [Dolichospermum sp. UHCC 0299]MTJ41004.1 DUF115 domain-containing protein [Dolichospermum sp. UHCC 0406]